MNGFIRYNCILLSILAFMTFTGCFKSEKKNNQSETKSETAVPAKNAVLTKVQTDTVRSGNTAFKVTFIELGSVRCIPCQHMQIVMKSIEEKYGDQVDVVFYDVWTPEGRPYGQQYGIQAIPTQVFLDENGKEFFRHEGYFPEEELVKVLNEKGVR
jgi:thioredoxin 1